MTISTQASRDASRLERRARAGRPTEDSLRADAQQHMDARQQRLEAYVASLQTALEASPTDDLSVRIADRLAQAQKDAHAASRRRIPQAKPAPPARPAATVPPAFAATTASPVTTPPTETFSPMSEPENNTISHA